MTDQHPVGWNLTVEQELFRESVREFCAQHVTEERVRKWVDDFAVDAEFNKAFYDAGFALMGIPEQFGGIETDTLSRVILTEELARATGTLMPTLQNTIIMDDICEMGTDEQIAFYLQKFKETGSPDLALAISEPGAGSDNAALKTTVKEVDGKLIMNGSKTFVSNGRNCGYLLVVAKDEDPSRENRTMSLWIVPEDTPGITMVDVTEIACRPNPFSDVYFDDVEIDPSWLLGERGKGFLGLMKNFEIERLLAVAVALGFAQAAQDDAAAYASQRIAFGQPIGNFQLVQQMLVDNEVRIQNMRNFIYKTAWEHDHGVADRLAYPLIKYYCAPAATEVCSNAMQIFGGIGFTVENRVSRLWQEARGLEIGGGTTQIMVHIAGRQLLKKYEK
jgi:crotonobetainyl-CoA dehydrogenase